MVGEAQTAPSGRDGSFWLHIALGVWGLCAWILFNGLWGQLPLFVRTLPEGNRLGVLMIAAEQLAYIFPLFFMFKRRPQIGDRRGSQEADIWMLLVSGLIISLLLSHFWNFTLEIGGVEHSVGLLGLAFLAGAVCSSTGVVFTPYLANRPKTYTSAHTAGAGLSGLVVALLTLVADSGAEHPRLPIDLYFQLLTGFFVLSILAFTYVRHCFRRAPYQYLPLPLTTAGPAAAAETVPVLQQPQQQHQQPAIAHVAPVQGSPPSSVPPGQGTAQTQDTERGYGTMGGEAAAGGGGGVARVAEGSPSPGRQEGKGVQGYQAEEGGREGGSREGAPGLSPAQQQRRTAQGSPSRGWSLWPVFVLQLVLSSLAYGVVPSILPIACTGYRDQSRMLMLSTVGYMIADPVGKIATAFIWTGMVWLSAAIALGFAGLLLACAILSPQPPLVAHPYGGLVPVLANTLFSFMFSFTSTSIFFQRRPQERAKSDAEAYRWFAWSAFMIQTGAFLGTFITLFIVVFT